MARNELYHRMTKLHTISESMFHNNAVQDLETLALYARDGIDVIETREYQRWLKRWF